MKLWIIPEEWYPVLTLSNYAFFEEDRINSIEVTETEFEELADLQKKFNEWQVRLRKKTGREENYKMELLRMKEKQ